ncbi:hypothetical protein BMW22_15675 [Rhizobium leguminosarum]|uniref:Uncharacterized protein n=1 Tax=Rhizobium leguminosarum TaxID=384 RepID=A0A1L3ZB32_RHILE|nr:hypothetical protein [Rhizobium leguminosarum]API52864.1 hypothetical protein BMW22_15675 [Rhizobium leguminosarum]
MTASRLDVLLLNRARDEIGELIESRTEVVINGSAEDHATYRARCGEINGLRMAIGVMEEIVRKMGDGRP